MSIKMKVSMMCYGLAFLLLALFGLRYIFAQEFMPYHAVALSTVWSELPPAYQTLFLALIRVAGGGLLATGIAGGVLLAIPFRTNAKWSRWTLLIIGLTLGIPTLYATLTVQFHTPASPPWLVTALGVLFILMGFLFSWGKQAQNFHIS